MHIPDGILPIGVCVAGYAVTAVATYASLRQLKKQPDADRQVPKAALLTAAFFVASWIHIPVPPTSVHLILNGLLGVLLGYYAVPSIVVGLFLQAVMFQHGGLTTLGVNAAMMGIPAIIAYEIFRLNRFSGKTWVTNSLAFAGGAIGLLLAASIAFTLLFTSVPSYLDVQAERAAILTLSIAHIPLALIEGAFAAFLVGFLKRVKPDLLPHSAGSKVATVQVSHAAN